MGRFRISIGTLAALALSGVLAAAIAKPSMILSWRDKIMGGNTQISIFRAELRGHLKRVAMQTPEGALFLIGDSHVQGLLASRVAADAVNLGIGGDRAADVLQRLNDYPQLKSARAIILLVGVNDLRHATAEATAREIAALLKVFAAPTILVAVPTVDEPAAGIRNADILELNDRLRVLCGQQGSCAFLSFNEELAEETRQNLVREQDGLHLNRIGYDILARKLSQAAKRYPAP